MSVIEPRTVTLKNGKPVCIRSPAAGDAAIVIDCLKVIFEDDRFFLMTAEELAEQLTIDQQQQRIDQASADPGRLLVVAEQEGRILCMANVEAGPQSRRRHIGSVGISIRPEWRGLGLGSAVIRAMIDWAAAHPDIEKLQLGVWSRNTHALALYRKMGFREEGRKVRDVRYAGGYYDDCIIMANML